MKVVLFFALVKNSSRYLFCSSMWFWLHFIGIQFAIDYPMATSSSELSWILLVHIYIIFSSQLLYWILFYILLMSSSFSLIRIQQPSLINQKNYFNNNDKQTRRIVRMVNFIYLFSTKFCLCLIVLIKRLLRFIWNCWSFLFLTLSGSRKKVRRKLLYDDYHWFFIVHSISIGEIL